MSADRTEVIAGLQQLAAVLAANPDVPLPINLSTPGTANDTFYVNGPTAKAKLAAIRAALPPLKLHEAPIGDDWASYETHLAGLTIHVRVRLRDVAEKTVVGVVEQIDWTIDGVPLGEVA